MDNVVERDSSVALAFCDDAMKSALLKTIPGLFSRVEVAASIEEALRILSKSPIDIIVCGSGSDGLGLFKKVREYPKFLYVPIVIVAGNDVKGCYTEALALGVDAVVDSSADFSHLLQVIKGQLVRSRILKSQSSSLFESYRKRIIQTLSHEFRTPLVAVLTGTEILSREIQNDGNMGREKLAKLVAAIKRGGQRLDRLVNDFMIMQQMEAGIIEKVFESRATWHSASHLLNQFEEAHRDKVIKEGFSFTVILEGDDFDLYTYDHHLFSILERLLSNAVKFTPPGRDVVLVAQKISGGQGLFEIHDEGPGIDDHNAKRALQAFEQIDRESLEQQGSGLGLSIASHLVQVNRGQLELCSRESGGTTARVVLPLDWSWG
jgi:signal transduction histidine kinase